MDMELKALTKPFVGEILSPSFDLAQDYAQLGLDEVLDFPALKEVPLIKSIVAIGKTTVFIRERHFAKKLLTFLREYHSHASETNREREFRSKLNSDSSFREKVVEHLLVIVDRYITTNKAKILGHLFHAHVNGAFDWDEFVSLSIVLDALQPRAYIVLHQLALLEPPFNSHNFARSGEALFLAAGIGTRDGTLFTVTPLGTQLYDHGIKHFLVSEAEVVSSHE